MVIDQYAFNQRSQDGNIAFRFLKGTFAVVSGLLAKIQPEKAKYSTPNSTIGIRGTEFVVKIELPPELVEDIRLRPGNWPNWRSSGAVTAEAMTSGLAPG